MGARRDDRPGRPHEAAAAAERRRYEVQLADLRKQVEKLTAQAGADKAKEEPGGAADMEDDVLEEEPDLADMSDEQLEARITMGAQAVDYLEKGGTLGAFAAAALVAQREALEKLRAERRGRKPGHCQLRDVQGKLDKKDLAIQRAEKRAEEDAKRVQEALDTQKEHEDDLKKLRGEKAALQEEYARISAKEAEAVGAGQKPPDTVDDLLKAVLKATGNDQGDSTLQSLLKEILDRGAQNRAAQVPLPQEVEEPAAAAPTPIHIHTPTARDQDGERKRLQEMFKNGAFRSRRCNTGAATETWAEAVRGRQGPGPSNQDEANGDRGDARTRTRGESSSEDDIGAADKARMEARRAEARGRPAATAGRRLRKKSEPPAWRREAPAEGR